MCYNLFYITAAAAAAASSSHSYPSSCIRIQIVIVVHGGYILFWTTVVKHLEHTWYKNGGYLFLPLGGNNNELEIWPHTHARAQSIYISVKVNNCYRSRWIWVEWEKNPKLWVKCTVFQRLINLYDANECMRRGGMSWTITGTSWTSWTIVVMSWSIGVMSWTMGVMSWNELNYTCNELEWGGISWTIPVMSWNELDW